MAYRGFKPLFDRVLVQRVAAETKSKVRFRRFTSGLEMLQFFDDKSFSRTNSNGTYRLEK